MGSNIFDLSFFHVNFRNEMYVALLVFIFVIWGWAIIFLQIRVGSFYCTVGVWILYQLSMI